MLETAVGGILLAIVVSMFLLALIILMFVLAREGKKPLAVSATNELAERDRFYRTCLRPPRKHCRRCQAGIWDHERQQYIPGLGYIGRAIAGPPPSVGAAARRQRRSAKRAKEYGLPPPSPPE
jgi:hypothetical protein